MGLEGEAEDNISGKLRERGSKKKKGEHEERCK